MNYQISLAAARKNADLKQEEVAKKLNIAVSTLVNWESGKSEPKISQGVKLSELYGIPLDDIKFG